MRFPGNCLVIALLFCVGNNRLCRKRNAAGRWHYYWMNRTTGEMWEFYKKGASRRTYLQNALYIGEVKRTK